MQIFHPTHQRFLEAFVKENVTFLLIGGYAVNYHGYVRATGDMDVWLQPDNENKTRTLKALRSVGIDPTDLKRVDETFDFENIVVFHFGQPPERIDFLTKVQGVNFDEAYSRREALDFKGMKINFLHLNDLIVSKMLANRPQDRADVDMLQKIYRLRD